MTKICHYHVSAGQKKHPNPKNIKVVETGKPTSLTITVPYQGQIGFRKARVLKENENGVLEIIV